MPVTPRFKVSQTDEAVVVCIKVPHVRVGNAETHVDGQEFSFYCKPYLLRSALNSIENHELYWLLYVSRDPTTKFSSDLRFHVVESI